MNTTTQSNGVLMLDAEALYQTLRQQIERVRQPHTRLAGITTGGAWLAERLQADWGLDAVGTISTAMHRDDFARRGLAVTAQTHIPFEVEGSHIVLLDDVLHTGRTIRAALNEIFDFGRPASVQLAVLVDRGGRHLPISADMAAARLQLPDDQSLALARAEDGRFSFRLQARNTQ